jgi:ParB/RepB/Spo0J family partition protein
MNEKLIADPSEGGRTLPLSLLKQSPRNPRTIGAGEIADLVASVASRGVVIPLLVRPLGDDAGCYEVVDGHRRLAAAIAVSNGESEESSKRVEMLPVTVSYLTDDEAAELQIVTNVQRDPPPSSSWPTGDTTRRGSPPRLGSPRSTSSGGSRCAG